MRSSLVVLAWAVPFVAARIPPALGDLRAGAASVKITPEGPVPLAGYGARWAGIDMKKSTGVHDDLYARALVLEHGNTRVALVACDLCAINAGLRQAVCRIVEKANLPIPSDHIMVWGSHTHAGCGGYILNPLAPPVAGFYTPAIFQKLSNGIAEAIIKAHAALAPARFGVAARELEGFNRNRRGSPTVDRTMTVLRFDGQDGKPIALLINFTAHPTIIDGGDMQVSRGWPGAMVDAVREHFGGQTEVLYANGAEGDASPSADGGPKDNYERAVLFGKKIAQPAIELAKDIRAEASPELKVVFNRFKLPASILARLLPTASYAHRVQIGGTWLMGLPGEAIMQIGLQIKERARKLGAVHPVVVGLADDHLMYFVTPEEFPKGGYEVTMNMYGPHIDKTLIRAVLGDLTGSDDRPESALLEGGKFTSGEGTWYVRLTGDHYRMGYQHGRLLRKEIHALYDEVMDEVVKLVQPEITKLVGGIPAAEIVLRVLPGGPKTAILPVLALVARPLNAFTPPELREEMSGLADGAEMPYDAVFLLNNLLELTVQEDVAALFKNVSLCTNVIRIGDRPDRPVIHARNLDWEWAEKFARRVTVFEFRPDRGNAFLSVGFPGLVGVLTAVNDKQLSLGNETVNSKSDRSLKGMPIMTSCRMAIQYDTTLEAMVARLRDTPGTAGMHILMADGKNRRALAVDRSAKYAAVRQPEGGVLLGVVLGAPPEPYVTETFQGPGITTVDEGERSKYVWLDKVLRDGSVPLDTPEDWAKLMIQPENNLCRSSTIHTTVMVPATGRVWVHRCTPNAGSAYECFALSP
mgnify:CR=1 FL=1